MDPRTGYCEVPNRYGRIEGQFPRSARADVDLAAADRAVESMTSSKGMTQLYTQLAKMPAHDAIFTILSQMREKAWVDLLNAATYEELISVREYAKCIDHMTNRMRSAVDRLAKGQAPIIDVTKEKV